MPTTFSIVPAGMRPIWLLLPFVVLLVLGGLVLLGAWSGSQRARFEISSEGLRLRGDIYGRLIPLADIRGGAARVLDIAAAPEYRPRSRSVGTALPGYQGGWFWLRNGEKALLFVTDWSHVVYVPTRNGYAVLLSPTRPQALVDAIRTLAPGS